MLLAALTLASLSLKAGAQRADDGEDLLLDIIVNGQPIGQIGEFKTHDGKLSALASELDTLGFKVKVQDASRSAGSYVPLSQLAGISYRFDAATQTVYFTAANAALKPTLLRFSAEDGSANLPVESGLGTVLNYNLANTAANGRNFAEGLLDLRVFSPWGVITSSAVGTSGSYYNTAPVTRLDTTYSYSDPDSLLRYRAGDVITGGLAWTRPVRLGGGQVTTDFGIRPDLITFPVPTIFGQVAVPSSVDVLVNGVQLMSRNLPPGPFEVRQLPTVTGAGDVTVVVHNAVGQDTTQTLPIYTSSLLLTPGLSALSAEMGSVRLNYGLASNDYRAPAAAFSYRRGIFDWLTLQGHAEGSTPGGSYNGYKARTSGLLGGGAAFTAGRLGVFSLDLAASDYGGKTDMLYSASFERITPVLSLSASIQSAGQQFTDIAAASGEPFPRFQARASMGLALGDFGSFGIAYVGLRRDSNRFVQQPYFFNQQTSGFGFGYNGLSLVPATKVSLVSTSFSRPVLGNRAYFYLTGFHDFASSSTSGLMAGITIPFGSRSSAGTSAYGGGGRGGGVSLQANQSTNNIGDWGGRAEVDAGSQSRQLATAEYKAPWALIDAGFDKIAGQTAYRGTVQGALAYTGGALFASNTINDSFAVVDTNKTAGIEVLQENRPVGRTGPSGLMLVPDLRSFDANRLAINPTDVPMDAEVGQTSRLVRPQDHSGVVVKFPIRTTYGAIVQLVDAAGTAIPVGSTARLEAPGDAAAVSVGYDGEAFVTSLQSQNRLTVLLPGGAHCVARFEYRQTQGTLPRIGPVVCKETAL
jgi:outer membrane usher protein